MRAPVAFLLAVASSLLIADRARAQAVDECNAVDVPRFEQMPDGTRVVEGPFVFRCSSGAELRADSGTIYPGGEILLNGNVFYEDADRTLTSNQATYSRPIRRLYATGDVVFTNRAEGTTLRGPELEYFAETPERPEAQVNAGGRPHLTIIPNADSGGDDPLEIDADRVAIIGGDDLSAYGAVVITRPDMRATAEEARFQGDAESLELRRNAVIESEENTLRGEVIHARLAENELQEVRARTNARLESKDLTVTAPDVQLFFVAEAVNRAVARRGDDSTAARPVALSRDFRLEADSIDAITPAQRLEQVIAIGRARGESVDTASAPPSADTTTAPAAPLVETPALIAADWLVGDTIIGYFVQRDSADGAESADTTAQLDRLVARGSAQSLYKVRNDDQGGGDAPRAPGVSYVAAELITVRMRDGEVDVTEVAGVYSGLYLDPAASQEAPAASAPEGAPGGEQ